MIPKFFWVVKIYSWALIQMFCCAKIDSWFVTLKGGSMFNIVCATLNISSITCFQMSAFIFSFSFAEKGSWRCNIFICLMKVDFPEFLGPYTNMRVVFLYSCKNKYLNKVCGTFFYSAGSFNKLKRIWTKSNVCFWRFVLIWCRLLVEFECRYWISTKLT